MSIVLEPEVRESWGNSPRLVLTGAQLSGDVSGRQFVFDRGANGGFRLFVRANLTVSTVTNLVVSAESVPALQPLLPSAGGAPSVFATEMYQAVPASGPIILRPLVWNLPAAASGTSAFYVPLTPLQGQFGRVTIGATGTVASGDGVSCWLGLGYV